MIQIVAAAKREPAREPASILGDEVLPWLRERTGEMIELLRRLVLAESPTGDAAGLRTVSSIVTTELEALGYRVEALPAGSAGESLLARPATAPRSAPAQLLLGHLDTVWPLGTLARMPLRIEEGRLHGPGVYDMKGGLAQAIFALRALRAINLTPPLVPILFLSCDEEVGSEASREDLLEAARAARRVFVLEPSFGPSGRLKTGRKGVARFTVRIRGRASHAGIDPEHGASAILEASHQVQRLFALNDLDRGTTVNVGTIDGGLRANVVAPEVTAKVDVRVLSSTEAKRLEAAVRSLSPRGDGISLSVEGGFERPPMEPTARNRALWDEARRVAAELEIALDEATVGGASDGNLTSAHRATLDGLGAVGDGAHAEHEHVIIERLPERAALLVGLMLGQGDGGR